MLDYKNGKIYKIVCYDTGEIYIGSTVQDLEVRLKGHRGKTGNRCCSKQIIDRGNYYIELIETYPCNSHFELRRKEGEYQKSIECINHYIAGRTDKEWIEDNKEQLNNYAALYRVSHKQHIKEYDAQPYVKEKKRIRGGKKVMCECGCNITYTSLTRHRRTKKHIDLMANI